MPAVEDRTVPPVKSTDRSGEGVLQRRKVVSYTFPAHSGPTRSVTFKKALILSHPAAKIHDVAVILS